MVKDTPDSPMTCAEWATRRPKSAEALVGTNRDVGAGYGDRVTLGWATMGVTMCGETGVSSGFGSYHGRVLGKRKWGGPRGRKTTGRGQCRVTPVGLP